MIPGGRNFKEIERKKIGSKSEQKQSKNRTLRNFVEWRKLLRNEYFVAKPFRNTVEVSARVFRSCEGISQLRKQIWHTSATSQYSSIHLAAAKRIAKWKSVISHQKSHSAGYFAIAKVVLAHECHFAAQELSFRSCETHCEVAAKMAFCCENDILLRNWPFSTKLKMTLNIPLFLFIPVIWAAKGFQKESAPLLLTVHLLARARRRANLWSSSPIIIFG